MSSIFKNGRTIRNDLMVLLMTAIIFPFVIITLLYTNNVRRVIEMDVKSYQQAIIEQSGINLIDIFSSINMIQRTTLGKVISDYIPVSNNSSLDKNEIAKLKDLIEFLYITDNASSYVNGIYVIFESEYIVSSRNGIREELLVDRSWIRSLKESDKNNRITELHTADYNVAFPRNDYDMVISYVQSFILPEQDGAGIIIQIDIDEKAFSEFIGNNGAIENIPMFLINEDTGDILLKNKVFLAEESKFSDEILVKKNIWRDELALYAYIQQDQITNQFNSTILSMSVVIIIIILLSIITAIYFSRSITAPLHELYLCMKKVGSGDFFPEYPSTAYTEVDYLIKSFETMVVEVDELITTVGKQESETVEAKFQALQAKINPHFLYNTLDVIRSIALEHNHRDISDMTLSLSRLFRYNVGNVKVKNTIGTEIGYIEDYLKIQSYRFGDRISTKLDISPELYEIEIPRFVIQPIIENAFKYGLELRGKGSLLTINAEKEGHLLTITITDNGPGIPEKQLCELKKSFSKEPDINSVSKAHGLENVNLRLQLIYGVEFGICIDSRKGEWTRVDVHLPAGRGTDWLK